MMAAHNQHELPTKGRCYLRRAFDCVRWLPAILAIFYSDIAVAPLWAASTAKIVGLGAAPCTQFLNDVERNPAIQRDYLAWAQGLMSGILLGRPPGIDEGLDLNPASFPLLKQLEFLRDHCARNRSADFSDAVEGLYKRLRKEVQPSSSLGD